MTARRFLVACVMATVLATVAIGLIERADRRARPALAASSERALAPLLHPRTASRMQDDVWRDRVERSRRTSAAWARYPPWSRPARDHAELLVPNRLAPTARWLVAGDTRSARIRVEQDRVFALPGERVAITLAARSASDRGLPVAVTGVRLRGRVGATLPAAIVGPRVELAPCGAASEWIAVDIDVVAGSTRGTVDAAVICTGPPPARFTGRARDAVEGGSLVIRVEVDVTTPGRYEIVGRLYDASDRAVAYLVHDVELGAGITEVPLEAYGALLLDERAVAPYHLRDIEGARLLDGSVPDRAVMVAWSNGHRTGPIDSDRLDATPWR